MNCSLIKACGETSYKFNGKEEDQETGLYYYGARYYDSKLSMWLSVDPKAEKFLNQTPYAFTDNNPINLVDPDGNSPVPPSLIVLAGLRAKLWWDEIAGATSRLVTGTSGQIPESAPVPDHVRTQVSNQATIQDATTVLNGVVDVAEGTGAIVGSIPGVETAGDAIGLAYNIVKGDTEGIVTYSLALAIPGVSANFVKLGKGAFKLANKLLKSGANGKLPVPLVNGKLQGGFSKMKGSQGYRHNETGAIYKKSNTTHGSQTDTQWKAYPKGTTDFSKNSGNRVTIDGDGTLIGN